MKPGPFEDVKYTDPKTKFRVTSLQDSGEEVEGRDPGVTKIFDSKGNPIWSAPFFVGRHHLNLSPDGSFLALVGNFYFTSQVQVSPGEQVAAIYKSGTLVKKVCLSDLFSENPEDIAEKRELSMKGGGWADSEDFITATTFNWSEKKISFTLYTNEVATISF